MLDSISIKIINLAKREDRLFDCNAELEKIKISPKDDLFFEANESQLNGAHGCSLSHAMALAELLFCSYKQFFLIFEDDFSIREPNTFWVNLDVVIKHANLWDVYLLGHNTAIAIEATPIPSVVRAINSQTQSGYLVKRSYAPKLIECFFRSAELLRFYNDLPIPNKDLSKHYFTSDQLWKELQIKDRYWISNPSQIFQRPSFSDIEKRHVDYGV